MQSEWYVGEPTADGIVMYDREALFDEEPRYVTFNGRTDALVGDNALTMGVGERARIYMVNEGLNLASNFHPIGSQWDLVYPEAATHPSNRVIRGSQSTLVVAGGGTVVELQGLVPSRVILVDHALVRTFYKGAIGFVDIAGDEQPEIFSAGTTRGDVPTGGGVATAPNDSGDTEPLAFNEVLIPMNAFDPANAAHCVQPRRTARAGGDHRHLDQRRRHRPYRHVRGLGWRRRYCRRPVRLRLVRGWRNL